MIMKTSQPKRQTKEAIVDFSLTGRRLWKTLTTVQLIMLCILGAIGGTVYWTITTNAVQRAHVSFKIATKNGRTALRDGDFATAAKEFKIACQALDVTGQNDEHARTVRRMHRESKVANRLATASLIDIINDAEKTAHTHGIDNWHEQFRTSHLDTWIVVQTVLTTSSGRDGKRIHSIDLPLTIGDKPVVLEANLRVFEKLTSLDVEDERMNSRPVIFAAQLQECRLKNSHRKSWNLLLRPDSAFLWSRFETLQALGFQPDELTTEKQIRELLDKQTKVTAATTAAIAIRTGFPTVFAAVALGHAPDLTVRRTQSIQSFNKLKPSWSKLVGRQLRLEGRYSSFSVVVGSTHFRFAKCDLRFRSKKRLSKPRGSKIIVVSGRIAKEKGNLFFAVDTLRQLPSDIVTFRRRRPTGPNTQPKDWYELGEWATARSKFYQDKELADQAVRAYQKGIEMERSRLEKITPNALLRLAEKCETLMIPDWLWLTLRHEAYQLSWQTLRKQDNVAKQLADLKQRIVHNLPGSRDSLGPTENALRQAYLANPLEFYKTSSVANRPKLHRILYSNVVLHTILTHGSQTGRSGFEIAQSIEKELPELKELAERHRERGLSLKLSNVEKLTQQQMLQLHDDFISRKRPAKADETLKRWLNSQEKRLRQEGPSGLIQLADQYVNLFNDKQTAVRLLLEAYKSTHNSNIAEMLQGFGYILKDELWIKNDSLNLDRGTVLDANISIGMSSSEVRKRLLVPTSITRVASAGKMAEVWIYGEHGMSRFVIHMLRRLRQKEAKVVGISHLNSQE